MAKLGFGDIDYIPRAVIIGDTDKDIEMAQNAGIDSIWVNHPENIKVYGQEQIDLFRKLEPTYEVSSFAELESLLFTAKA